jgi:hypothetical protein
MTEIEDRLRAAVHAAADTVADDSAPPLRLTGQLSRRGQLFSESAGRRRRFALVLAPIAAAVAVLAIVLAAVALSAGHRSVPAGQPTGLHAAPPYYLTQGTVFPVPDSTGFALTAVIRDTVTGKALATIRLPKPYVYITSFVGAAANDRTFVLAAQAQNKDNNGSNAFFVARFDPANNTAAVTRLRIPVTAPGEHFDAMALSPAGTQLAIALDATPKGGRRPGFTTGVRVYSLATGSVKVWTAASLALGSMGDPFPGEQEVMSWSGTGLLAIDGAFGKSDAGIRLLNTAGAGGSLLADSRAVHLIGYAGWHPLTPLGQLTQDGSKIVGWLVHPDGYRNVVHTVQAGKRKIQIKTKLPVASLDVAEFSTATGHTVRTFSPVHGLTVDLKVLWSSSSGSVLVVEATAMHRGRIVYGVLSSSGFLRLPGAPTVGWLRYLAF